MQKSIIIQSMSDPEISYVIEKLQNGSLKCSCKSYFYSSQKIEGFQCKHIKTLSVNEVREL